MALNVIRPGLTKARAKVPESHSIKYRNLDTVIAKAREQWYIGMNKFALQDLKFWVITRSLIVNKGNLAVCAEDLGVSLRTLGYNLHVMGVKVPVAAHERKVWLEELEKTQIIMPAVPLAKRGPRPKNNPVK